MQNIKPVSQSFGWSPPSSQKEQTNHGLFNQDRVLLKSSLTLFFFNFLHFHNCWVDGLGLSMMFIKFIALPHDHHSFRYGFHYGQGRYLGRYEIGLKTLYKVGFFVAQERSSQIFHSKGFFCFFPYHETSQYDPSFRDDPASNRCAR